MLLSQHLKILSPLNYLRIYVREYELSCSDGSGLLILMGLSPETQSWMAYKSPNAYFWDHLRSMWKEHCHTLLPVPFPCQTTQRFSVVARTVTSVFRLRGLWLNMKKTTARTASGPSVRSVETLSNRSETVDSTILHSHPPPFPKLLLALDLVYPHSTVSEAIHERERDPIEEPV